ncbi:MAG: DNA polymerase III subunit delta' [Bacteroidota bacterium]
MWDRVIGQERVKRALLAACRSGRLSHAYLFYGAEGTGKDAMALELARVLRCEQGGDEACGECSSCRNIASMQDPDVRFVTSLPAGKNEEKGQDPLEKLSEADLEAITGELRAKGADPYHRITIPRANLIKINSIRELRRESSMSTAFNRNKVFIISQADAMEAEGANTLLKTLEEPPGRTMLILTTAHPEALLPTIRSRCQLVRFDPLTEEEIRDALIGRGEAAPEQAGLVARLANGSYTRARELLQEDMMQIRRDVVDLIRRALMDNVPELLDAVERVAGPKDRDETVRFLSFMLVWFRDALVLAHGGRVINLDQQAELASFMKNFPGADLTRALADVERAISLVERYAYIKLVLIQLVVNLREAILPGAARSVSGGLRPPRTP